jgi:hypothetical protein
MPNERRREEPNLNAGTPRSSGGTPVKILRQSVGSDPDGKFWRKQASHL